MKEPAWLNRHSSSVAGQRGLTETEMTRRSPPIFPLALWAAVPLAALALSAGGWKWSHNWPSAAGMWALPVVVVTQTALAALFAPRLLGGVISLVAAVGIGVVIQLAAVAIDPRPLPMVPWSAAWLVLWVGGLGAAAQAGGVGRALLALVPALIALEIGLQWAAVAGSGIWPWPGPIAAALASSQPDHPTSPHWLALAIVLVLMASPITTTFRRVKRFPTRLDKLSTTACGNLGNAANAD